MLCFASWFRNRAVLFAGIAALASLWSATGSAGYAQQPLQVMSNHVPAQVSSGQAALVGSLPGDQRLNL